METDKKIAPGIAPVVLATAIAVVSIILFVLALGEKQKIEIAPYINVTQHGTDGHGYVSASIDWNAAAKNIESAEAGEMLLQTLSDIGDPFSFEPAQNNQNIKNGTLLEISIVVDKEKLSALEDASNCKILYPDVIQHLVTNLPADLPFDPFENLIFDSMGTFTGEGAVNISAAYTNENGEQVLFPISHNGINGQMSNGNEVTLSLNIQLTEEEIREQYGIRITRTSAEQTLNCFHVKAYNEVLLENISDRDIKILNHVADEWAGSALNDGMKSNGSPRTCELASAIFFVKDSTAEDAWPEGVLSVIYRITEPVMPERYVTFSIPGKFSYTDSGIYLDLNMLPELFTKYDKESIRFDWETQTFSQGEENQAVMLNGVWFAGHATQEDAAEYVKEKYQTEYPNIFSRVF